MTARTVDGYGPFRYRTLQFHFHEPSEHVINNQAHDLELHIVHSFEGRGNPEYNLAVLGVFFEEGPFNEDFEQLIHIGDAIDLGRLLGSGNCGLFYV